MLIWIERASAALIAALAFSGIFLQAGLHKGKYILGTFSYYTNLSNLFTGIYQVLILAGSFSAGALYGAVTHPVVRYSLTLMILVTHLVYHFILVPDFKKRKGSEFAAEWRTYQNLSVHYAVPLLATLQWLVCADKAVPFWAVWAWLAIPMAYLIFAMVRAWILGPEPRSGVYRYPYAFMDLDAQGFKSWIRTIALVLCFYIVLGLALYGVSWLFRL